MKYIWEVTDIIAGRKAALDSQVVTILFDPFPKQEHRKWRVLHASDSTLSCDYSASEVAAWLTASGFAPF